MTSMPLRDTPTIRDEMIALKRERIIESAIELFYAHGYENATLEAVAERLSVTKPFIYSYFKSKTDLLGEICGRGIRASLDAIKKVVQADLPPTEQVRQLSREFVTAVLRHQKAIAIFAREEKNLARQDFLRISDMRRDFDHTLSALLERGVHAGEFDISDTRIAALAIGGMVSWAYVWYRPAGRLGAEQISQEIANLILSMLRAKPRRARISEQERGSRGGNKLRIRTVSRSS